MRPVRKSGTKEIQACMASVVRNMVPEAPTIQQTLMLEAEPARRSVYTPLICGIQFRPLSLECSSEPAGPMRQACFPPGAQKTWGFRRAAVRITARALAGAAETSTDSVTAEFASRFSALDLGAERFDADGGAGTDAGGASLSAEGAGTEPPARKAGSEGGGAGEDAGAFARDPAARPGTW